MATEMSSIRPFFTLWCKTNYSHSPCPQNTKTSFALWCGQIEGQFWQSKSQTYIQAGTSFKKKASATFLTFSVSSPLTFEKQIDLCVVCMILSPGSVPGSVSGTLPSRCLSTLIWSLKVTFLSDSGKAAASWQPLSYNGTFHLLVAFCPDNVFPVFGLFSGCPFYSKPGQASCNTPCTL